jgi:hypothetical protein
MKKKVGAGLALAAVTLGAIVFWGYQHWQGSNNDRDELLLLMPASASAVVYVDLQALRNSPFLTGLFAWAPRPSADAEYAEFVQATGFNYERDLDNVAIGIWNTAKEISFFALADGRFDKKKITTYAMQSGTRTIERGREIYSVTMSGSTRKISFAFMKDDRVAITDQPELSKILLENQKNVDAADWQSRFARLGGSPIFAVLREEAGAGGAVAALAPKGWRSPQLSALLDQLRWITLAGKPQGDRLEVVIEGESRAEGTAQQIADLLNGILVLAQAGLNDSKTRKELDPAARDAYLELVRGADVTRIDRGETKSVRLVFEVTPKLLQVAQTAPAKPVPAQPPKARR